MQMNCQEASHLLDADPQQLSREQREDIRRHVESCRACGEEWANWQAMVMLPVPATSPSLWPRILAALPVARVQQRRTFRPLVIGGVLLAGVALAAAWMEWGRQESSMAIVSAAGMPAATGTDGDHAHGASMQVPASAQASASGHAPDTAAADAAPSPAMELDPHRVLVLKRPEAAADARIVALADQCHDAVVRELRSFRGVDVVVDAGAPRRQSGRPFTLPESDRGIAREHGAGRVVSISTVGGCQVLLHDVASGAMLSGVSANGLEEGRVTVDVLAPSIARDLLDKVLLSAASELAQARAIVLDTSRSDGERIAALQAPRRRSDADAQAAAFFDAQVIAAAIQLGTKSSDAGMRTSAWSMLRNVDDPSLVKPLLQVLAKDPDAQVRYQAAINLNLFLDAPGVREALRKAAAEDPSSEPQATCCVLTVREAVQRSLVADKDYGKWVLDSLLDESLPVRSRLISLQDSSPDGRFRMFSILDLGDEAARIVFDIGQRQRDAGLRTMAWTALNHARPDDAFAPVLVEDMASHADEYVRAAAATALAGYADRPEVRAAFERAMSDQSIYVRRAAGNALAAARK
jgi:hypothetical protein